MTEKKMGINEFIDAVEQSSGGRFEIGLGPRDCNVFSGLTATIHFDRALRDYTPVSDRNLLLSSGEPGISNGRISIMYVNSIILLSKGELADAYVITSELDPDKEYLICLDKPTKHQKSYRKEVESND